MSEPDAPLSCPACGRATKQHRAGTSLSGTARHLSVSHQSVINWISAAAANIPPPPMPAARQGEPAGGAGSRGAGTRRAVHLRRPKKEQAYVVTCVDRATRCILGWRVLWERVLGACSGRETRTRCKKSWTRHRLPAAISVTGSTCTQPCCMRPAGTRWRRARARRSAWKVTTRSCGTLWRGRGAGVAVLVGAYGRWCERWRCLFMPGTGGRGSSARSRNCPRTSAISLPI